MANERDVVAAYHHELHELANVDFRGWIDVSSPAFVELARTCIATVYPSASEGQAGAVAACMQAGIPICSRETGLDLPSERGDILATSSIDEIERAVRDLAERRRRTWPGCRERPGRSPAPRHAEADAAAYRGVAEERRRGHVQWRRGGVGQREASATSVSVGVGVVAGGEDRRTRDVEAGDPVETTVVVHHAVGGTAATAVVPMWCQPPWARARPPGRQGVLEAAEALVTNCASMARCAVRMVRRSRARPPREVELGIPSASSRFVAEPRLPVGCLLGHRRELETWASPVASPGSTSQAVRAIGPG